MSEYLHAEYWMPVAAGDGNFALVIRDIQKGQEFTSELTSSVCTREGECDLQNISVQHEGEEVVFSQVYHTGVRTLVQRSVALSIAGDLYAWETGSFVGSGDQVPRRLPFQNKVMTVALGYSHCIAIDEKNQVFSWGINDVGQCGNGDITGRYVSTPTQVLGPNGVGFLTGSWAAAGVSHSLLVTPDGTLYSFGCGDYGQLGNQHPSGVDLVFNPDNYPPTIVVRSPVVVIFHDTQQLESVRIYKVAAGAYHSIALDDKGNVFCWGRNHSGQVGMAEIDRQDIIGDPILLQSLNTVIIEVAAGFDNSFAVTAKGRLYTWGMINAWDGIDEHSVPYTTDFPEIVRPLDTDSVVRISVAKELGPAHTMVVLLDGTVLGCQGGAVQSSPARDSEGILHYNNWYVYQGMECNGP